MLRTAKMILFSTCFLLMQQLGILAKANISPTAFVNYVSETAMPGETVDVQGGGFTAKTKVMIQLIDKFGNTVTNSILSLSPISRSANLIQVKIPSNYAFGLWRVWVTDDLGRSTNARYVHRAVGVRFSTDEAAPGGTLEIWGRNLGAVSVAATSSVLFVGPNGVSQTTSATEAGAFHLTVTVPTGLKPGIPYRVYVTNGLGGKLGQTPLTAPLSIRNPGPDPLQLGVSWGADFTFLHTNLLSAGNTYNVKTDPRLSVHAYGDGVHNDTQAIQNAIYLAGKDPAGGGLVYLPAGTYLLGPGAGSYHCIGMASHTVVVGDGPGKTNLTLDGASLGARILFDFYQVTLCGLDNLSIQSVNASGVKDPLFYAVNAGSSKLFFDNLDVDMGTGQAIWINGVKDVLVANSTFTSTSTNNGIANLFNDPFLVLENNTFDYGVGRINLSYSDYPIVRNNSFNRFGSYSHAGTLESGAVEISYDRAPIVTDNEFTVSAGAQGGNNDGEAVLAQDADVYTPLRDVGTISSAAGFTVKALGRNWSRQALPGGGGAVIFITSGPALGQWRYVTGVSGNIISIDRPWDFAPPVGSGYAIGVWSADRAFVLNNTFSNPVGSAVEFYDGAWYSVIGGNQSTTTADQVSTSPNMLWLHSTDTTYASQSGTPVIKYDPAWQNLIVKNVLTNASSVKCTRIEVQLAQVNGGLHGVGILNTELRYNSILSQVTDSTGQPVLNSGDGYWNFAAACGGPDDLFGSGTLLGTILESNQGQNIALPIYHVGLAAGQTITD